MRLLSATLIALLPLQAVANTISFEKRGYTVAGQLRVHARVATDLPAARVIVTCTSMGNGVVFDETSASTDTLAGPAEVDLLFLNPGTADRVECKAQL